MAQPRPDDLNWYLNFVLYAVYGQLGLADRLYTEHKASIDRYAAWLREHHPPPRRPLYRGVLVEPAEIRGGRLPAQRQTTTFVSFSEDKEVACWFAAADSFISGFVLEQRPRVRGYLIELPPPAPSRLLFHHAWIQLPVPDGRTFSLEQAAMMNPALDASQVIWNLRTQSEVITTNKWKSFPVTPIEDTDCASGLALDRRFVHPTLRSALRPGPPKRNARAPKPSVSSLVNRALRG